MFKLIYIHLCKYTNINVNVCTICLIRSTHTHLPIMRGNQFGGVLQVLFKAQFKSLTYGADDLLSQAL